MRKTLLNMRTCRKGLIQTPEQLRFSYSAILEGSKAIVINEDNDVPLNGDQTKEQLVEKRQREDDGDSLFKDSSNGELNLSPPHLPLFKPKFKRSLGMTPDTDLDPISELMSLPSPRAEGTSDSQPIGSPTNNNLGAMEVRRRAREERNKKTTEAIKKIKDKQKELDERSRMKTQLFKFGCVGLAFILGAGFIYGYYYPGTLKSPRFS